MRRPTRAGCQRRRRLHDRAGRRGPAASAAAAEVRVHGVMTSGGEAPERDPGPNRGPLVRPGREPRASSPRPRRRCGGASRRVPSPPAARSTSPRRASRTPSSAPTSRRCVPTSDNAEQLGRVFDHDCAGAAHEPGIHRHGQRLAAGARDPSLRRDRRRCPALNHQPEFAAPLRRAGRREGAARRRDRPRVDSARRRPGRAAPMTMDPPLTRTEHDSLGGTTVPGRRLLGRPHRPGAENFPISGHCRSAATASWSPPWARSSSLRLGRTPSSACSTTGAPRRSQRPAEEVIGRAARRPVRRRRRAGRRRHLDQHERQRGHRQPGPRAARARRAAATTSSTRSTTSTAARAPTTSTRPRYGSLSWRLDRPAGASRASSCRRLRSEGVRVRGRSEGRPDPAAGRGAR